MGIVWGEAQYLPCSVDQKAEPKIVSKKSSSPNTSSFKRRNLAPAGRSTWWGGFALSMATVTLCPSGLCHSQQCALLMPSPGK